MPFRFYLSHFLAAMMILVPICSKAPHTALTSGCRQQAGYTRCTVCKRDSLNITCPAEKRFKYCRLFSDDFKITRRFVLQEGEFYNFFNCNGSQGVIKIMSFCQDKPHCFIPSYPYTHGFGDPCFGVQKYTDINLTCSIPTKTLRHLKPAGAEGFENLENKIEEVFRNHPETNGTTYDYGDTRLHIVVTNFGQKQYKSILELGSTLIDFTLQTNNVSRIIATVLVYKINTTETAQTQMADASSPALTRFIAVENTNVIVIIGWDADRSLHSSNHTKSNDPLSGNTRFVVSPTPLDSLCKKLEAEKYTSNLMIRKLEPTCFFFDKGSKNYSDVGCVTSIDDVTGNVTCKCNHLTIFTVLLAVETFAIPIGVKITTYTTEAASIAFLLAAIVILFKHKRCDDRVPVQINLSVALLFHAVNISHDLAVLHEISCVFFTVTIHYLLLCVGMWFLIEGVRLVMATSFPFTFEAQDPERRLKILMIVGWIVPAFLVGTAAGVGFSDGIYMKPQPLFKQCNNFQNQSIPIPKYDRCWLTPGTPIFHAYVVAPLALVLFINFKIILKTTHVIFKMRRMQNRDEDPGAENALSAGKSFFLLIVMLGGTWSLAFFTGIGNEISNEAFMYINGVVNGSQGIVVFLLYCFMNHVIRQKILPCKSQANAVSYQLQETTTNTGAPH